MSLISEQLKNDKQKAQAIQTKVNSENLKVSEKEILTTSEVIKDISFELTRKLGDDREVSEEDIKALIQRKCVGLNLSFEEQKRIEKNVLMTALGNGPIEPLLHDDSVTEIIVQAYDSVLVERNGILEDTEITFNNEEHLMTIINRIVQKVGRQINLSNPIVDARLVDGSRVNAIIPPASPDGPELVIRKFSKKALSGKDYLELGSLSKEMLYFLNRCVTGKISIFISGSTGTGKTTLLNMLSSFIPATESIITIEDTCELQLQQPRVRRREVRELNNSNMMQVDQQALVKAALRQRPDRIILGETRDGSIVDLISAMSTGHDGSMSTIHANSPNDMVNVRIPILYSKNKDVNFTEQAINMQIASAIRLVCQIKRYGGDRKVSQISAILGTDPKTGKVKIEDIFRYLPSTGEYIATGFVPEEILDELHDKGIDVDRKIFVRSRPEGKTGRNNMESQKKELDRGRESIADMIIRSEAAVEKKQRTNSTETRRNKEKKQSKELQKEQSRQERFEEMRGNRQKEKQDIDMITDKIRASNSSMASGSIFQEDPDDIDDILGS